MMPQLWPILILLAAGGAGSAPPPADVSQVVRYFDQYLIFLEAENLTTTGGDWRPLPWAHSDNYYSATIANTFHSRRGYLRGPVNSSADSVATGTAHVAQADNYTVLVRYEAPYRFEVPFLVTVEQDGKTLLKAVYGRRTSPKVWAFGGDRMGCGGPGLVTECAWPYGATENMVWEGVNTTVTLAAGTATISLTFVNGTSPHQGNRNVDLILLHPNRTDIDHRLTKETEFLPLDGLINQAGEVFVKVQNHDNDKNLTVAVPPSYIHSPYFGRHLFMNRSVEPIFVEPGGVSEWVDVGVLVGAINHGTWNWPNGVWNGGGGANYSFTIGVKSDPFDKSAAPKIVALHNGVFDARKNDTSVLFEANTRAKRLVRHVGADLDAILASFEAQGKVPGKPLAQTPVWAQSFSKTTVGGSGGGCGQARTYDSCKLPVDPAYPARAAKFFSEYVNTDKNPDSMKGVSGAQLGRVVSNMGDEVMMRANGARPPWPAPTNEAFHAFLRSKGIAPAAVACASDWHDCNMTDITTANASAAAAWRYYLTITFENDVGIADFKNRSDMIRTNKSHHAAWANLSTGANFSPTGLMRDPRDGITYCSNCYIGNAWQWVRGFREGAMTMPWSEDWIFATPIASQQIMTMSIDAMRSGIQWRKDDSARAAGLAKPARPGDRPPTPKRHLDMMMYISAPIPPPPCLLTRPPLSPLRPIGTS